MALLCSYKSAIVVLFISLAVGYFYGSSIHSYVPPHVLKKIHDFMPDAVMRLMHPQEAKSAAKTSQKKFEKQDESPGQSRIFTKEELWNNYRGDEGSKGLYLAFFGKVYDVSAGKEYYAPGGGYHFFAGRDGTKGFVTGDFTDKGLTDNLDDLDTSLFQGFDEWLGFYDKTYKYVGIVVGNFYDEKGQPTKALKAAKKKIAEAQHHQDKLKAEQTKFPLCNSESSAAKGSRVWCSKRSGGIERDWVGVPRMFHASVGGGTRCACIRNSGPPTDATDLGKNRGDLDDPRMKEYKGCKPDSPSCITVPPK